MLVVVKDEINVLYMVKHQCIFLLTKCIRIVCIKEKYCVENTCVFIVNTVEI